MKNYKLSIGDIVQLNHIGLKYIVITINDKVWLDLYSSKENIELYDKIVNTPAWESIKYRIGSGALVIKELFFGLGESKVCELIESKTINHIIKKRLLFERMHGINKRNNA